MKKSDGTLLLKRIAVYALSLYAAGCVSRTGKGEWKVVYKDHYRYNTSRPYTAEFNTWFWREDAIGTHVFNYVDGKKCTGENPCVKLIAPVSTGHYSPQKTPYINGEMYNNSCVRQGPGQPEKQPYDNLLDLGENPWDTALYAHSPKELHANIGRACDEPYPYRKNPPYPVRETYSEDSWNTTTPGLLTANLLAQWIDPEKEAWQKYRDFAFNTPYYAQMNLARKIEMNVKAEGRGGGTRGWGYWNTSMNPFEMQFAWFMEFDDARGRRDSNKTYMMTVKGLQGGGKIEFDYCVSLLPEDVNIYTWHDYAIEWRHDAIIYRVDGKLYATHTQVVPDKPMAFHNWVDNRSFFKNTPENFPIYSDRSNYISAFIASETSLNEKEKRNVENSAGARQNQCGSLVLSKKSIFTAIMKAIINDYLK